MLITNVLIGILLGTAFTFSRAGFIVAALFAASVYLMRRYIKTEAKKFLITIFVAGFILRIALAMLNYNASVFMGIGSDTQPDARVYNTHALYIASINNDNKYEKEAAIDNILKMGIESARNANDNRLPSVGEYQFGFYVYILGWIYTLFGYAPVAVKALNGLAGCLIGIMTYFAARFLVKSESAAKVSAGIMMFLPSALYWSSTLLRDTINNFLFLFYIIPLIGYLKNNKAGYLIVSFVSLIPLGLFKDKLFIFFAIGFIFVLLLKFAGWVIRENNFRLWAVAGLLIAALIFFVVLRYDFITAFFQNQCDMMIKTHLSSIGNTGAATYNIYGDTAGGVGFNFLHAVPKALAYYFFAPFPWRFPHSHKFLLLFYPQVIFNFICVPFTIIGVWASLRREPFLILTTIALLILAIVPQAMTEGVIGGVVRHRDMFMPFFIIFAIYGFFLAFFRKERLAEADK